MSAALDALAGGYPAPWLRKLGALEAAGESVDLDAVVVAGWESEGELVEEAEKLDSARAMLVALAAAGWCDLAREWWECPICFEEHDALPAGDLCASGRHLFTAGGAAGPIHHQSYHRAGFERRHVGWLYALHGMNTRGDWQEEFNWRVSISYGRMVPVRIQKYGVVRPGVLVKFRQRQLVDRVARTLRIARKQVTQVTDKAKPDVIAHSFGTWLIGHALQTNPDLEIGRVILLGCALRPDFDWAALFRRKQVEAVLNHYGTKDKVIPLAHYGVPDAGPSGRRGFDSPVGWDGALGDPSAVLVNLPQEAFGHSSFFEEQNLATMFSEYWAPFLAHSDLSGYPHLPSAPWPAKRWKPKPWPLRAIFGGPGRTW